MKSHLYFAILSALAAALSACTGRGGDAPTKPLLAVSIEPQRKMLEELAGDRFEVVSVMPAGANPETYDPPMSTRAKIADAKAYFTVGHLPFEQTVAPGLPKIDTSVGIMPVTGTHSHGHEHDHAHEHSHAHDHAHAHDHGDADPHVWTSLRNAKAMTYIMMTSLVEADPTNAETYRSNFARMAHRYDSLDNVVAERLAGGGAFAVWHPSLSYFARDYGLRQIAVGQESKEMPIGRLKEVIDAAKANKVKVFFFQKEYDSRQAENVNKEIGSRIVNINPLAYDWEEQIMIAADELSK